MNLFNNSDLQQKFSQINPRVRQLAYDSLTPILAYTTIGGVGAAMMESAYDEGYGKYSFIGINPLATLRATSCDVTIDFDGTTTSHQLDPYSLLPEFTHGRKAFGFITYDGVRVKERLPDRHPPKAVPDFFFRLYKTVICFDHQAQKLIISHEGSDAEIDEIVQKLFTISSAPNFTHHGKVELIPDVSDEEYMQKVIRAKEYIRQGDIFQVVLSRTFIAELDIPPFALYRALRKLNPTPYLYLFEEEEFAIAGASPELLVGVKDGVIETVPIAGTCKKGDDINLLLADPKETAEHIMLVDLARNDVGAVAKAGTVTVTKFKNVKTYSHVSHIVSHVVGQLDSKYNQFDVLKSVLPAGTLSGAPKIRAMEIIDELEMTRRGLYGGAVLMVDEAGSLTAAIAIRTMFIQNKQIELRVGAGIVYDSVPEKEVEETYLKARGAKASIELAMGGGL
ncbi:MAG: anthranilate synthase component I family protein [Neisseriaceae bacterium]|nr:MAG: anthranilate synthase component I family protein [Neisseriaceae bacterium]